MEIAKPPKLVNLKANPRIKVEWVPRHHGTGGGAGRHRRAELWPKLVAEAPAVGGFQPRPRDRFGVHADRQTDE